MASSLSTAQKRILLRTWYAEAQACGIPFCQYLQTQAAASLKGATAGAGRRVTSASRAGESATYGDADSDVVPQDESVQFQALTAEVCLECEGTDEEKFNCLLSATAVTGRYLVKSNYGLRGCGC